MFSEKELLKHAKVRVQKYVHSGKTKKRLAEIKQNAQRDPKLLQVIVCDEAHYSATSQPDEDKRETPYSLLVNWANSEDYPNVIVILVTATPWNLVTTGTKLPQTQVEYDENGRLKSSDKTLAAIKNHRKTKLHEITSSHQYEGDLSVGKKTKLMVSELLQGCPLIFFCLLNLSC